MSLTENRIQKSINIINTDYGMTAEVLWINQVIKAETVIAESNERCAYSAEDKERFIAEIVNAELYLAVLGWE